MKDVEPIKNIDAVCIVGKIEPPLSQDELDILAKGPKFCIATKLSNEQMEISLAEHKQKRIWENMNNDTSEIVEESELPEKEKLEEIEAKNRRIYDFDNKTLSMANLRVTDTRFSRRTILTENRDKKLEAQENLRRATIMNELQEYKYENCDDKGRLSETNITKNQERAIKSLQKRVELGDAFITTTDKSSKMAIIEMKEYIRMGEVHTKNDRTIDEEEFYVIIPSFGSTSLKLVRHMGTEM